MNHAVMSRRKSERADDCNSKHDPNYGTNHNSKVQLSDSFQELMYIQFLNLNVSQSLLSLYSVGRSEAGKHTDSPKKDIPSSLKRH